MRLKLLLCILIAVFSNSVFSQLYKEEIIFDYKSEKVGSEQLVQVKKYWERLPMNRLLELILISRREMKRLSPLEQTNLTRKRAESIKQFLITQRMVDPYDLEINLRNFIEPEKAGNSSHVFRRRVRMPYKTYSLILSKEVAMCFNLTEAEKRALDFKPANEFEYDTNQDTTVIGREGVIVNLPAHAFRLPDNKLTSRVKIRLWEFLADDDIILAGLSTSAHGKLLETGGMIYITAEHQGRCVQLLQGVKFIVRIPTREKMDSMYCFQGIPMPKKIDWKNTGRGDINKKVLKEAGLPVMEEESDGGFDSADSLAPMEYYVFAPFKLGWINCDRFSGEKDVITAEFDCPAGFKGCAYMVFTDIRSIMDAQILPMKSYSKASFPNVPRNKNVFLIFLEELKGGKFVKYALQKAVVGKKPDQDLVFKIVTKEEFTDVVKARSW